MPSIQTQVFTIGTATTQIVDASSDAQEIILQNLEPNNDVDDYAKEGRLYLVQQEFDVASPGTAIFQIATGAMGAQIQGYEILSTNDNVKASLIEGATVTTTGSAITAYNMNRNFSDAHDATLLAGTAISGGTVIAAEFITADKHAAGGGQGSGKIFTLEPSTNYAMTFVNRGNQTTTVFFQMMFAEKFNGHTDVWIDGAADDTIRLRGGETLQVKLIQSQTLSAVATDDNQLAVLRQD